MSAVSVRDLFVVRDEACREVEQHTRAVLINWARDWLPGSVTWSPKLDVACCTSGALSVPHAHAVWSGFSQSNATGAHAWAASHQQAVPALINLMLARDGGAPLADDDWAARAADAAYAELHTSLLGQLLPDDASQPDLQQLSGSIVVHEQSLGLTWVWGRSAYRDTPAKPQQTSTVNSSVAALTNGLSQHRLQISAGLGEVDIPMSDLLALQVGDVIRFPALLKGTVPLSIEAAGQPAPAAQAQLGQRDGHVAVKLVSPHKVA